jgi:hypothetical protein
MRPILATSIQPSILSSHSVHRLLDKQHGCSVGLQTIPVGRQPNGHTFILALALKSHPGNFTPLAGAKATKTYKNYRLYGSVYILDLSLIPGPVHSRG